MGKPFAKELENLSVTHNWLQNLNLDDLCEFFLRTKATNLLSIGSGGSYSAAYLVSLLQNSIGSFGRSYTPFEAVAAIRFLDQASTILISAGGRNKDIVGTFKHTLEAEILNNAVLCMSENNKLKVISDKHSYSDFFCFAPPIKKDGFLATNSLLSFMFILSKAFMSAFPARFSSFQPIPTVFDGFGSKQCLAEESLDQIIDRTSLLVIHGYWSAPSAIDFESKCSESGLRQVLITDIRNFAHGRHYWLKKRCESSAVIYLMTPDEEVLFQKTAKLISNVVPSVCIKSQFNGPAGSIDLMLSVFQLINLFGKYENADPGKPKVPEFGRKIYNLGMNDWIKANYPAPRRKEEVAIRRKLDNIMNNSISDSQLDIWYNYYGDFIRKLKNTSFGAIVFDFDGTLCDRKERFTGCSREVAGVLNQLLENQIIIGVATGRGKSVKAELKKIIKKNFWQSVFVGYYNGSEVSTLSDDSIPNKRQKICPEIQQAVVQLKKFPQFEQLIKTSIRSEQISIMGHDDFPDIDILPLVEEALAVEECSQLKLLISSHSIDIIPARITKLSVVEKIRYCLNDLKSNGEILCIGDQGKFPGNDYELLSSQYSLSVGTVSSSPESCWNLNPPGTYGVMSTLAYLTNIQLNKGSFSFKKP